MKTVTYVLLSNKNWNLPIKIKICHFFVYLNIFLKKTIFTGFVYYHIQTNNDHIILWRFHFKSDHKTKVGLFNSTLHSYIPIRAVPTFVSTTKKNNSKSNLFKDEFHSYNPNPAIPTFNITTKKTINKLISSHRSTAAHALQSQTNPSGFSFLYFLWDNIAVFSFFHLWINRIPNTTWKKMAKDIMMTSGQTYLSLELFSRTDRSWDTFAAKRDASHKCRTKFCLSVKWLVCTCPFDS